MSRYLMNAQMERWCEFVKKQTGSVLDYKPAYYAGEVTEHLAQCISLLADGLQKILEKGLNK